MNTILSAIFKGFWQEKVLSFSKKEQFCPKLGVSLKIDLRVLNGPQM